MSSYTPLGRDEQSTSGWFVRTLNPTDLEQVAYDMRNLLKEKLPWDYINPQLWRMIGMDGGPLLTWLKRVVLYARQRQISLAPETAGEFEQYLISEFDYPPDDTQLYLETYLDLYRANKIPQTIRQPWGYTPTTTGEDIAQTLTTTVAPILFLLAVGSVAAYAFFSKGLPRMAARRRTAVKPLV
jgi:hypothetical protein